LRRRKPEVQGLDCPKYIAHNEVEGGFLRKEHQTLNPLHLTARKN
jgi:hypothetical protein